jgi:transposase
MKKYDKQFKEEAVKLSNDLGSVKKAAEQLGISYHTLSDWRGVARVHGADGFVGSGKRYAADDGKTARERELEKKNAELERANEILKDALAFFAEDRKK